MGWTVLRICDVVEVGQVEYLPESVPVLDRPCSSATVQWRSARRGKRKRGVAAAERLFEFEDEPIVLPKGRGFYSDNPNFEVASNDQDKTATFRGRNRILRVSPVFQFNPR